MFVDVFRLLSVGVTIGISMLFASSFVTSFWPFLVLFGVGYGICNGLTYMVPMHHGWLWYPDNPGLVSGIVISGFGFGALIFGTVARVIVNPDNAEQDKETKKFPPEVNDAVPKMLMILTASWAVIAVISIMLIFPGKDHTQIDEAAKIVAAHVSCQAQNVRSEIFSSADEMIRNASKEGSITGDDTHSSMKESILTIEDDPLIPADRKKEPTFVSMREPNTSMSGDPTAKFDTSRNDNLETIVVDFKSDNVKKN